MKALILINDTLYGTDRLYNGLRMTHALTKKDCEVTVFLIGDAVSGAKTGQKTPEGFYNAERTVQRAAGKGKVLLCGTCMDARGISEEDIVKDAQRSTMEEQMDVTTAADKVLVF